MSVLLSPPGGVCSRSVLPLLAGSQPGVPEHLGGGRSLVGLEIQHGQQKGRQLLSLNPKPPKIQTLVKQQIEKFLHTLKIVISTPCKYVVWHSQTVRPEPESPKSLLAPMQGKNKYTSPPVGGLQFVHPDSSVLIEAKNVTSIAGHQRYQNLRKDEPCTHACYRLLQYRIL